MSGLLRDRNCRCFFHSLIESRYSQYTFRVWTDIMVSQANFFRDDISGELFPTPAEAIESERESRVWVDELFSIEADL